MYFSTGDITFQDGDLLSFYNGGTLICRVDFEDQQLRGQIFPHGGGTPTIVDSGYALDASTYHVINVHHWTEGGNSYLNVYINGSLDIEASLTSDSNNGFDEIQMIGGIITGDRYLFTSELILANEDTRDMRVLTLEPTGDGTHTDWGAYTDLDDIVAGASYLSPISVGDAQTFTAPTIDSGLLDGMGVAAVAVNVLGAAGVNEDLQALIRVSGTDYSSSDLGMGAETQGQQAIWETNPSTAEAWGVDNLSGLEFGFKSVSTA